MLVTLANNQHVAAAGSQTFTYSPTSVQKVLLRVESAAWELASVTVQIGSVTICNGINLYGLKALTTLQCNVDVDASDTKTFIVMDFGSHQCTDRDNLYVTIQAGASELSNAVDISAIVDEPGQLPLRITNYTDNTFVSPSNLMAVCYDVGMASIEEDTTRCEVRTPTYASSPTFASSASYHRSISPSPVLDGKFGVLNINPVPLETSYNYPSGGTADSIITVEQMPSPKRALQQSEANSRIVQSQRSV